MQAASACWPSGPGLLVGRMLACCCWLLAGGLPVTCSSAAVAWLILFIVI